MPIVEYNGFWPKHTCIFEMEWKQGAITGEVVCRICGAKPSACPDQVLKLIKGK